MANPGALEIANVAEHLTETAQLLTAACLLVNNDQLPLESLLAVIQSRVDLALAALRAMQPARPAQSGPLNTEELDADIDFLARIGANLQSAQIAALRAGA